MKIFNLIILSHTKNIMAVVPNQTHFVTCHPISFHTTFNCNPTEYWIHIEPMNTEEHLLPLISSRQEFFLQLLEFHLHGLVDETDLVKNSNTSQLLPYNFSTAHSSRIYTLKKKTTNYIPHQSILLMHLISLLLTKI